MRLLFIKLKHIGDALLLTPTLTAARAAFPQAKIWVVVRRGTEGILEGCPAIDRVLTTAPPETTRRNIADTWKDIQLVLELRRQAFDWAFELSDGDRGRWLARLAGARETAATGVNVTVNWSARRTIDRWAEFDWTARHRVEKDFETVSAFVSLPRPIPPLSFERSKTRPWPPASNLRNFVVFHPGTRWMRKRWPAEDWVELGRMILSQGFGIVVSSGPDEEERNGAQRLKHSLGENVLTTDGTADWAQLAGLLYRARLFVGVDTAAMHLAAACQCPTLAIFGPSLISQWRPWNAPHRIVTPSNGGTTEPDTERIRRVAFRDVLSACLELLEETNSPIAKEAT